jgi:hypothetical protein
LCEKKNNSYKAQKITRPPENPKQGKIIWCIDVWERHITALEDNHTEKRRVTGHRNADKVSGGQDR